MNTILHTLECFTFTDQPLEQIKSTGLKFSTKSDDLVTGCHSTGLLLPTSQENSVQLLFHVIENESLLVEKKIMPVAHTQAPISNQLKLPLNSEFKLEGMICNSDTTEDLQFSNVPRIEITENELIQYWQIRKKSPIWALVLQTQKLPESNIVFQQKKAFHLHLHANMFDFILLDFQYFL